MKEDGFNQEVADLKLEVEKIVSPFMEKHQIENISFDLYSLWEETKCGNVRVKSNIDVTVKL